MLLIENQDVQQLLNIEETIGALRTAYLELREGKATYGPRIDYYVPTGRDNDYYQWGNMVGASSAFGVLALRMKSDIVTWGDTQEKYCVEPGLFCGLIMLFNVVDGEPVALIHDGFLQHMRVGAAAGIGMDLLARRDARTLCIIGSGGMARTFVEAFATVRRLEEVRVYSPTRSHREAFAADMSREISLPVIAVSSAEEAVRGSDIVATATDSMAPTFDPEWLTPGVHVVCVTRRELSEGLIDRADRVVQLGVHSIPYGVDLPMMDWRAGSIASYVAGTPSDRQRIPMARMTEVNQYPTMLDVETGQSPGRLTETEITVFVATGTQGLQFAAVGGRVWQLAVEAGLGRKLPRGWFLQDIRD